MVQFGLTLILSLTAAFSPPQQGGSSGSSQSKKTLVPGGSEAKKPDTKEKPKLLVVPLWTKVKPGHTFYQTLVVTQKPRYQIQGLSFQAQLRYSIVSQLSIKKRFDDGKLLIEQKVLAAKLNQADQLTQPLLMPAIKRLPGTTFSILLNKSREVVGFKGYSNKINIVNRQFGLGQGLQVASLLDEDGWKELTNATFFFPDASFFHGQKWVRKMTHSWGPLGSWAGLKTYVPAGQQQNIQRIAYVFQMKYFPPGRQSGRGGLGIGKAMFQPQQAKGFIYFDRDRGRVAGVEEYFRVRGMISLQLLGNATPVMIDEEQGFQIRLSERNPLVK